MGGRWARKILYSFTGVYIYIYICIYIYIYIYGTDFFFPFFADSLTETNPPKAYLELIFAARLGFGEDEVDRLKPIELFLLEFRGWNITERRLSVQRRLQQTLVLLQQEDVKEMLGDPPESDNLAHLPVGNLTVEVVIWKSTYKEAVTIIEHYWRLEGSSLTKLLRTKRPAFADIKPIQFNFQDVKLSYIQQHCPNSTGVISGALFQGAARSCKCIPGMEPVELVPLDERLASDGASGSKCMPCRSTGKVGMYKPKVGDDRCSMCEHDFKTTEPVEYASKERECACAPGEYRTGSFQHPSFECIACPIGFYCTGGYILNECPPGTTTKGSRSFEIEDCECDRGWFRALGTDRCTKCDQGYYKNEVGDGAGRCTQQCSSHYGVDSSSNMGSRHQLDCYCVEGSYMAPDNLQEGGFSCRPCPSDVECLGNFTFVEPTLDENTGQPSCPPVSGVESLPITADGHVCYERDAPQCAGGSIDVVECRIHTPPYHLQDASNAEVQNSSRFLLAFVFFWALSCRRWMRS